MANRYNPPPGWQVPGEGWRPPYDWVPDPAWPPAPVDWNFWIDDDAAPGGDDARLGPGGSRYETVELAPAGRQTPLRWIGRWYGGLTVAAGLVGLVVLTAVVGTHSPHPRNAVLVTTVPPATILTTSWAATPTVQSSVTLTAADPTHTRTATRRTPTSAATWSAPHTGRPSQTRSPAVSATSPTRAPKPPKSPTRTQVQNPPSTTTAPTDDPPPPDTGTSTEPETPPSTDPGDSPADSSTGPPQD